MKLILRSLSDVGAKKPKEKTKLNNAETKSGINCVTKNQPYNS